MVVDDLASIEADAVVRPATDTLDPTSAALRQLERIGGSRFQQQLQTQAPLVVGAATVTGAGDLPAGFVIHAIIRSESEPVFRSGVKRALVNVLQGTMDDLRQQTASGNATLEELFLKLTGGAAVRELAAVLGN